MEFTSSLAPLLKMDRQLATAGSRLWLKLRPVARPASAFAQRIGNWSTIHFLAASVIGFHQSESKEGPKAILSGAF